MSMPLSMEFNLITEGYEKRVQEKENVFTIQLSGYRLFPMDQRIDIMRHEDSDQIGTAKITELRWENEMTTLTYQLLSLYNVN